MTNQKNVGAIVFYAFIVVFIVIAYLNNQGTFTSLFLKKTIIPNKKIVQLEFKDKEYKADYAKKFEGASIEIARFEEGEKWKGDYKIDDVNPWEGKTSYVVLAKGVQPNILTLRKNLNLSKSETIKILIYSVDQQNTDDIKKALLRFGNLADTAYFEYDIRNIKTGWNIIEMPKSSFSFIGGATPAKETDTAESDKTDAGSDRLWGAVEKVTLELDARPGSQVELSFDRLWAEKDEIYKKEFLTKIYDMLSPRVWNGKSYINAWAMGATSGLINKVSGVRNFTYTAKIIPQKVGSFGINARTDLDTSFGYYLDFGGIGTGSWRLYKYGKVVNDSPVTELDSGGIANFLIEADQPLWLRIAASGSSIAGYLSTDGTNFTKLTEKSDGELISGGIGIQTAASFLLESVEFSQ